MNTFTGSTMIDVGAHFGTALAPFLDLSWDIYAFEPDQNNRSKLLEYLSNHKNKKYVTLDTRCVSNTSEKGLSFYCSEQSTGISGLSAFHETHVKAQEVDTTTLTDFFEMRTLPDIDFLKIDTEGHDLFVLQGFPWGRCTPKVIECEFEDSKTVPLGYTFHNIADFLIAKGYTVFVSEWHPIVRYGICHDWKQLTKYPCELSDDNAWGNLLAFRDSIDTDILSEAVSKVLKVSNPKSAISTQNSKSEQSTVSTNNSTNNLTIRSVNKLFRQGEYKKSLEKYIQLYQIHGLEMYGNNALMAARKVGMPTVNTIGELIEQLRDM